MRRQTAMDTCIRIACDADRRHEEPDLAKAMVVKTTEVDSSKLTGNNKKEIRWL